jgi:8-oxo-dGTP pyrophosphatase MutT (NUDIX family)
VLLVQRGEDERRWAGMWQFPSGEALPGETASEAARRAVAEAVGLAVEPGARAVVVRHGVTRFRITLEVFDCGSPSGAARAVGCRDWRWVRPEDFHQYALPAAHRKIADRILGGEAQLELGLDG